MAHGRADPDPTNNSLPASPYSNSSSVYRGGGPLAVEEFTKEGESVGPLAVEEFSKRESSATCYLLQLALSMLQVA